MRVDRFNRYHLCSAAILSIGGLLTYSIWNVGEPLAIIAGATFSLINAMLYGNLVRGVVELKSSASVLIVTLLKFPLLVLLIWLVSKQSAEFLYSALIGAAAFVPAAIYVGVVGYREADE